MPMRNRLPAMCQLLVRCRLHRLQHRVCHQHVLIHHVHHPWQQLAEQETEPEVTQLMSVIPQSEDVPVPQAFPYVTHTVDSDRDDVRVTARTPFGSTLVQHVCRNMNDVEANEAVVNKNWFRQVADAEAPHFSSKMKEHGVSTRLHMTRPTMGDRTSSTRRSSALVWQARQWS